MRCFLILFLFVLGCGGKDVLRLDNQIKNEMKYSKVFLNNTNSITVIGFPDENGESKIREFSSDGKKLRIIEGEEKLVVWHTYGHLSHGTWDVIVYVVDGEISGGEHHKGKFGKEKLHELGDFR